MFNNLRFLFIIIVLFNAFLFACQSEKSVPKSIEIINPQSDHHVLENEAITLKIAADTGARIASLQFNGIELLSQLRDTNTWYWGSTVWPAPQSDWNWPPPELLDKGNYKVESQSDRHIFLRSPMNAYKTIQATKLFQLKDKNTIDIRYDFYNKGDTTINLAIWENSRIPYAGKITWETGELQPLPTIGLHQDSISTLVLKDHKKPNKLFVISNSGWVNFEYEGICWTKKFKLYDKSKVAFGQAPIEIYYDPYHGFGELEVHGKYVKLPSQSVVSFNIQWILDKCQ